jgi:signal transduction histidine kinase
MWLAERRERSLLSLFELSHELGITLDPYGIAQVTLFSLMGSFGTASAAFWLLPEEESREAVLMRAYGLREGAARALGTGLASKATAHFGQNPGPVILADWGEALPPEARMAMDHGLAVLVPVTGHRRLLGLIALGERASSEPYWPIDLEFLSTAAGMVGVAIQNTRLYHGMLEANRRLRESNDRLTELDRLKSEFLQTVNHELRTPIAIIVGYLTILQDATTLEPAQRQAVAVSLGQAEKLTGMVRNLLEFSDLSEDTTGLRVEAHELESLLRGFADRRRPGLVQGPRELVVEIESPLPRAWCDPARLIQALDALMENAIKFTAPGAHIRLAARRLSDQEGDWVAISVADDGPGIPKRNIDGLLEPFRQVDGSTTRRAGGMGLGLALVQEIAQRMGGRLSVESELGAGSTFTLSLRVA